MADPARRPGAVLPTDASPEQQAVNRLAVSRSSLRTFRMTEAAYPTARDQLCLLFQVNTKKGWKVVFVVKPDGTFEGVP